MKKHIKLLLSFFIILVSTLLLAMSIVLAELVKGEDAVGLIVLSVAVFVMGLIIAICIDLDGGKYKCPECGNVFKPTPKAYVFSMHTWKSRHLVCPLCRKRSWCERTE